MNNKFNQYMLVLCAVRAVEPPPSVAQIVSMTALSRGVVERLLSDMFDAGLIVVHEERRGNFKALVPYATTAGAAINRVWINERAS